MIIRSGISVVALLIASFPVGGARAADMPMKAAPAPAPAAFWAGSYIGGHLGYGWNDPSASFNPTTFANGIPAPAVVVNAVGTSAPFTLSTNPKGLLGGLQVGHNWQSGAWVYGAELDFTWADMKGDANQGFAVVATIGGDNGNFTGNFHLQRKIDWFGTFRGRLGYGPGPWMVYGTAGLAWGHVKDLIELNNVTVQVPANYSAAQLAYLRGNPSSSSSTTKIGYTVGGGAEWAFAPNWSLKGEYLYIDLGSASTLAFTGASMTGTRVDMHVARAGVNWRFTSR